MALSSRLICSALISEYIHYRENSLWTSMVQRAVSFVRDVPQERKKECEELIKKIKAATSLAEKMEIIDLAGEGARRAQELKKEAEEKWKLPHRLLSLFVKDNSLWAKTLHALRTYWIADILKSEDKEAFLNEIKKLKEDPDEGLINYNNQIDRYLDKNLSIADIEKKRDCIYNKLLDRQDWETIKNARKNKRFPVFLPTHEDPKFPDKVTIYSEIPLVYHPNYFPIFFLNELRANPQREVAFNEELKRQLDLTKQENKSVQVISMLDKDFFKPIEPSDFVIEDKVPKDSADEETLDEQERSSDETKNTVPVEAEGVLSKMSIFKKEKSEEQLDTNEKKPERRHSKGL